MTPQELQLKARARLRLKKQRVLATGEDMRRIPDERIGGAFEAAAEPQANQSITTPERRYGFTENMLASLPFGDEVAAAGGAVGRYAAGKTGLAPERTFGESYQQSRALERAAQEEYQTEHPGGDFGSRLLSVAAIGPGKAAVEAPGILSRMWQGAKGGAGVGALYGAGEGGDADQDGTALDDRAWNALEGAGVGAAAGGAVPVAASAVRGLWNAGKVATGGRAAHAAVRPESSAQATVARGLRRDGVTVENVDARLRRSDRAGSPMAVMDVAGDSTRRLARTVSNVPGRGGETIRKFVELRKLEQPERVMANMRQVMGDPALFLKTADDVLAERAALAKPLYDQAYAASLQPSTTIRWVLETPAGKSAFAAAQRLAANEGQPLTGLTVRGMDLTKRGLDDMIDQARRGGAGNEARIVSGVRSRLLKEIDSQVPAYAQARQVYADRSAVEAALQKGRDILKADPQLLAKEVSAMSSAEREAFQLGTARAVADIADRGKRALVTFLRLPQTQKLLHSAFPSDQTFRQFNAMLLREGAMNKTTQAVGGNSTTAAQLADMSEGQAVPEVVTSLVRGDFGSAAMAALRRSLGGISGINERTGASIAKMLTSKDTTQIKRALRVIEQRGGIGRLLEWLTITEGSANLATATANR